MADNKRKENLNIQIPVDEDGNVAHYPTQATFQADPSYINVDETAPENVKEFQEATYNAIQAHARDRGTIEELRILISKRLNGQPITDNQLPLGEPAADVFVKRLRAFTNQEVQTGPIQAQLEKSVGVPLDKILKYCVKCFFTLGSYKKKQKFFQALFHEDFIKQLKNSYVSEEFRDRVTTIRNDVVKEDGTTLTEEERATVSQFLQKILSEITITIWLELDQLLPLLDEQQDSEVVSHITITIDLTGEPKEIQPPTLDAIKKTLSKAISNGNETIRKEFANLIDPVSSGSGVEASADIQVPTGDHQVLSEGQHPGKSEEIIRLVVRKLLDKYEEDDVQLVVGSETHEEVMAKPDSGSREVVGLDMNIDPRAPRSVIVFQEAVFDLLDKYMRNEDEIKHIWEMVSSYLSNLSGHIQTAATRDEAKIDMNIDLGLPRDMRELQESAFYMVEEFSGADKLEELLDMIFDHLLRLDRRVFKPPPIDAEPPQPTFSIVKPPPTDAEPPQPTFSIVKPPPTDAEPPQPTIGIVRPPSADAEPSQPTIGIVRPPPADAVPPQPTIGIVRPPPTDVEPPQPTVGIIRPPSVDTEPLQPTISAEEKSVNIGALIEKLGMFISRREESLSRHSRKVKRVSVK